MNKKLFCGLLFVMFAIFIFAGCGGGGGSSYITQNDPIEYSTKPTQVNPDGTVKISTVSNLILEAKEENTFDKDVFIQIKEKDSLTPQSKYFSNASRIYSIKAEKSYKDALGVERKTSVTTIDNPVLITIPNTIHRDGTYFLGFRGNTDDVWNYSAINSENSRSNPMVLSSRLSLNNNSSEFIVSTYNVDMQFMLFLIPSDTPLNKTSVSDFAVKLEPSEIKTDEGVYLEDLKMIIDFTGDKLNGLKPDDVTIVIDFLNNDSTEYSKNTISVTGATLNTSRSLNDAGAGNRYVHTMSLSSITDFSTNSLSFKLGLKKVSMEMFPKSFNVTFKTRGSDEILPYSRTGNIELIEAQKPETRYIHAMLKNPAEGSFIASTTTTLQIQMPEEIKWSAAFEKLVTVRTDNASDTSAQYSYSYANSLLTIKRQSDFISEASYTVSIGEGIKAVADYTELASASFSFSTISDRPYVPVIPYVRVASIVPPDKAENVATSTSIVLTFDGDIIWTADSEKKITLSIGKETVASSYEYSDRVLTITHKGLAYNKLYTLNVADGLVASDSEAVVASCSFCFMTEKQPDAKVISITETSPKNGDTGVATNSSSIITVTFEEELDNTTDWEKFVTVAKGSDSIPLTFAYADKTLTIHHNGLENFTNYIVMIDGGIKGTEPFSETESKVFSFTTVDAETTLVKALMTTPDVTSEVSVSSQIVVTFSDDIAWSDECKSLVVLSQEQNTIECNYDYKDKTITLQPIAGLLYDKLYTVAVSEKLSPVDEYKKLEGNKFSFTTQRLEITPQISGDSTKALSEQYYLVSGQEFTVNFNKLIINEDCAKSKITMKRDNVEFTSFTVGDFDSTKKLAKVIVTDALEAGCVYSVSVASFTDGDNSVILPVTENFNALPNIEIVNSNIASGATDIPLDGSITVEFSVAVATDTIKLVDNEGNEIASGVVCVTSDKAATIEMIYTDLKYPGTYGLLMEYTDNVTGQRVVRQIYTFSTAKPEKLVPLNPNEPNSIDNPYLIYTAKALDNVRNDLSAHYRQMSDIDLSSYISVNYADEGWLPIGTDTVPFSGSYDGNDFKISNLYIESSTDYCGLFSSLTGTLDKINLENVKIYCKDTSGGLVGMAKNGMIQNCTISNTRVNGGNRIGGLVGVMQGGSINNCSITKDTVSGISYIGGFIGELKGGSIDKCSVDGGNIMAYNGTAGGFVAYSDFSGATLTNCSVKIETITAYLTAGGLIGEVNKATIEKCNAEITEQINATYSGIDNSANLGGLVGYASGDTSIRDCNAKINAIKGDISLNSGFLGGLIGYCYRSSNNSIPLAENCSSELNCTLNYCDSAYIGGLVGYCSQTSISKCYAKLNLSVSNDYCYGMYIGGAFGYAYTYSNNMQISECFAECHISGGYYCGGLIGQAYSYYYSSPGYTLSIDNCYAKGEIVSASSDFYAGGLIGEANASYNGKIHINNSYSDCIISNSSDCTYGYLGGLISNKYSYGGSGVPIDIKNCFTTQTQTVEGNELSILGNESTGSDTYDSNFRSPDGYMWSNRSYIFSEDWDSTIWDGLDTPTPKLKNVGGQE